MKLFQILVLSTLEKIMGALEDLQAAAAANKTKIAELTTKVEEGNNNTDTLITAAGDLVATANATKDALVALQSQGDAALAAKLAPIIQDLNDGTTAAQASIDSISTQETETTAATGTASAAAAADKP